MIVRAVEEAGRAEKVFVGLITSRTVIRERLKNGFRNMSHPRRLSRFALASHTRKGLETQPASPLSWSNVSDALRPSLNFATDTYFLAGDATVIVPAISLPPMSP